MNLNPESGSLFLKTPEELRYFRLCQHYYALRIEIETGLHHSRGSIMKSAKTLFGCKKNTKKGVFAELEVMKKAMEDARSNNHN